MTTKPNHTTLDSLNVHQRASVSSFSDEIVEEKMMEMGCLPGVILTIERFAPFGDPMMIKIEGASIALRKEEAKHIQVIVE